MRKFPHRVVRTITYEGTEDQIRRQMKGSLRDGLYEWLTRFSVRTSYSSIPGLTGQNPDGWNPSLDEEGKSNV